MMAAHSSPPGSKSSGSGNQPTHRGLNDGPWWLYPALLLGAIVITALLARPTHQPPRAGLGADSDESWLPDSRPEGETVSLTIDFGNGAQRSWQALRWREGMTVAELMASARDFSPSVQYEQRGEGAAAFIESLEGVAGGGADRRNWLYQVNGEHANEGVGARKLQSGDAVLWKYDFGE